MESSRKQLGMRRMILLKKKCNRITKDHGPDAFAGISSARCTNEENYVLQKMIRAAVGTNSVDC